MANEALAWAWAQELDIIPKFILVYLADRADENFSCFPGQKKIAATVGVSDRTVRGHLATLEEKGYIARERRSRENGSRTSDRFYLGVTERYGLPEDPAGRDAAYRKLGAEPTGSSRPFLPEAIASGAEEAPEESPGESSVRARERKSQRVTVDQSGFVVTAELLAWAKQAVPDADVKLETEQFRDHHRKLGTTFVDWVAAWRTWMRNTKKFAAPSSTAGQPAKPAYDWMNPNR